MPSRLALISVLSVLMAGCMSGQNYYRISDGQRVDANPEMLAEFQVDRTICDGEVAKANLATDQNALLVMDSLAAVERACMAERGYVVR